jgi:hypothetical protein
MSVSDNLGFETVSQAVFFHLEIVSGLQVEPKSLACAKKPREPQGRIRSYVPLPMNNLVDAPSRDTNALSQPILADAHRRQEFL